MGYASGDSMGYASGQNKSTKFPPERKEKKSDASETLFVLSIETVSSHT